MSLEATETMRATMDTCLRFISGEKPLSKEEVAYQVNSFFTAAREIQHMFDHVISIDQDTKGGDWHQNGNIQHKFQVQEEIDLLRQEIATKEAIIAKIGEKTLEWEARFLKLKQDQHNELCSID